MEKFLKENWIYILLPILLVLGTVLYLALTGDNSDTSGMQYDL